MTTKFRSGDRVRLTARRRLEVEAAAAGLPEGLHDMLRLREGVVVEAMFGGVYVEWFDANGRFVETSSWYSSSVELARPRCPRRHPKEA